MIGSLYLIAAILWLGAVLAGHNTVGAAVSFTAVMATMVALFSSLHGAAVLVQSAAPGSRRTAWRGSGWTG